MSEDTGGERGPGRPSRAGGGRDGRDADARPVTAAGRRRRAEADDDTGSDALVGAGARTGGKGAATPTRERQQATPKGSPVARLRRFLREVVAELRKVHWPTRRQLVTYTIVVLVFVAFMVALVAGLDAVFAKAVFALFG